MFGHCKVNKAVMLHLFKSLSDSIIKRNGEDEYEKS